MAFATAAVGAGASIFGALTQAEGAEYQGRAQSAMYNYQAGVADVNARLAAQDTIYAAKSGDILTQRAGMEGRAIIGATKVAQGGGNIQVGTGSAGRVVSSEVEIAQQNEAIAAANARKQAYGFRVAGAEDTAQAGAYRSAAGTSTVAAGYQAEASILGGVASVASKFGQMGQSFGTSIG